MNDKQRPPLRKPRREWDERSLNRARRYGFFWYDWLWQILRPTLIFFCAALILFGGIGYTISRLYGYYFMPIDQTDTATQSFFIESGSSLSSISKKLESEGFIRNNTVLKYLMDFKGLSQKVKAGEFQLSKSMNIFEIADELTTGDGKPLTRRIRVIEGWTIETIAANLVEQGAIESAAEFVELCKSGDDFTDYYYIAEVKQTPKVNQRLFALEGYLAPDTYEVYMTATPSDIIRKLLSQTQTVFTEAYRERAAALGLTMDQTLTLASMIEKEAKQSDFAKVSAIFHNRLDRNMTLGSDVTVKYSTGSEKMALSDSELSVISAYNTYTNTGLPVGPICNPSKAAIDAALYPDNDFLVQEYLYFCSTDPTSGSLYFSKTLAEHNAAVATYRPLWEEYDRNRGL